MHAEEEMSRVPIFKQWMVYDIKQVTYSINLIMTLFSLRIQGFQAFSPVLRKNITLLSVQHAQASYISSFSFVFNFG